MKKQIYKIITQPTKCPACNADLVKVKDQLFCRNESCEAQSSKKLEHYAKVLKIKGLGPKSIEKLGITTITELYDLSKKQLEDALGKNGVKIYSNIQVSKTADLASLLHAFSINLVGSTAGKKLSAVISHIEQFDEEKGKQAGLGQKTIESILDWVAKEYFGKGINKLPLSFKSSEQESSPVESNGLKVCITGKLVDFKNRTEAGEYLKSKGYIIVSGVSKNTDILIDEEGRQSSKRTKAESLNIDITTIKQLIGD
jgi:NAD-dependent DNA ligase